MQILEKVIQKLNAEIITLKNDLANALARINELTIENERIKENKKND